MIDKFWVEDISVLFRCFPLIPQKENSLEENMNALTKITIFIFLVLFLISFLFNFNYNFPYDFLFLFIAISVIIIFYYSYKWNLRAKQKVIIENYGKVESVLQPPSPRIWNSYTNDNIFSNGIYPNTNCCNSSNSKTPLYIPYQSNNLQLFDTSNTTGYADKEVPLEETISTNQRLVGPPNSRTLVQPVIPSPIYNFEVWALNDFVVPTMINDHRRQELYQNGYIISQNYPQKPSTMSSPTPSTPYPNLSYPTVSAKPIIESYSSFQNNGEYPIDKATRIQSYNQTQYNIPINEAVNTSCGYHPKNIDSNLPINYSATSQQLSDPMKQYNDNLFSIPLQPGIYTKSQVNQPYASMYNLGISQDQPFLPTLSSSNPSQNQSLKFTEYDPSNVHLERKEFKPTYPLRNEIYDPRYTGYGTSYRHYIEPMTGQSRFYYDDIEQITQPNYITRNKLDVFGFGSQIGNPSEPVLQGDLLRNQANNNYIDNQLMYRTELQQRLLHKNNNRQWQQRQAPISTTSRAFKSNGTMSGAFN